jgi:hypothetical protein
MATNIVKTKKVSLLFCCRLIRGGKKIRSRNTAKKNGSNFDLDSDSHSVNYMDPDPVRIRRTGRSQQIKMKVPTHRTFV